MVLRFLRALPLLVLSPLFTLTAMAALAACDLAWALRRPRTPPDDRRPSNHAASIVIPNWNGRDLLEKYLPSVVAAAERVPGSEIIVVDNGSSDGSAEFVEANFPSVRLVALEENLGFGGGSNAGVRAAHNDVIVLLNNDMRVEPDFLAPLLEAFTDEKVFAVSCQIFFSDPGKRREETGLTEGWWELGMLRVRHRIDNKVDRPFPCFYGGGGSCAFDRRKFLELGGFDELLAPFYLEDTDLGYRAWKRGWKVLYQPASKVWHEHRGTIGKRFSDAEIRAVLHKNFLLFAWKNIHEWSRLLGHFFYAQAGCAVSAVFGEAPDRASVRGLWRAWRQLPGALRSRWAARRLALVDDAEAFRRPLGGYFRDRFEALPAEPDRLRVLFVSPYPICPPVHGGAVFMLGTCRSLARLAELHVIVMLDRPDQRDAHAELTGLAASVEFLDRDPGRPRQFASPVPRAVREFASADLRWLIHRKIYLDEIDVVQLEYLPLGQYAGRFRRLVSVLFEHDIYFQSIARSLPAAPGWRTRLEAAWEYMRALRHELRLLPRLDRVQVCSRANAEYLLRYLPELAGRLDADFRAGIEPYRYEFRPRGREPKTMLFLGSFRHLPNLSALRWMVEEVLPRVLEREPEAKLVVVGSDPPPPQTLPAPREAVEFRGFVEDVREPLGRYAVFVCPVRTGSGVRVKLLEAFAAGIPVVSTRLGAEGLAEADGEICALADDPGEFAARVAALFQDPEAGAAMAERARRKLEALWNIERMTAAMVDCYRRTAAAKRRGGAAREAELPRPRSVTSA